MKINVDYDRTTAKTFKARSLPTILFVTPKGKRVGKIVGYLPPDQFADKLESVLTIHRELSAMKAKFKSDPTDLETGGKLGAAYAERGEASQARKIIRALEAADPNNDTDHVTNAYLAMGEYYLDEKERPAGAIRWYSKAVDRGHEPGAVADARYRIALAYYTGSSQHAKKARKFGQKLRSAQDAIDGLMAMSDIREDLRQQADDLTLRIRDELAEHEKLRGKK